MQTARHTRLFALSGTSAGGTSRATDHCGSVASSRALRSTTMAKSWPTALRKSRARRPRLPPPYSATGRSVATGANRHVAAASSESMAWARSGDGGLSNDRARCSSRLSRAGENAIVIVRFAACCLQHAGVNRRRGLRFGANRERHVSLSKFQANKHIVNETGDSAAPFRFGPVRLRLRGKKMKAQLKPRINLEGRTALETVIPLSTPFVVFVDPASSCNFKCTFCPTGHRNMIAETGRFQGVMKLDVFQKVIDDLGAFDKPIKVLRMYKDGEPFLNKRLADMVAYARRSGHIEYIDTTTNGTLISPERVGPVLEAGIDKINISVDGMDTAGYVRFTGFRFDFDAFVENVKWLYANKG